MIPISLSITVRSLFRSRAYSLTAIGSLTFAIGTAVAMFAVVDAVLLQPLPVREPERLVGVSGFIPNDPRALFMLNPQQHAMWRAGTRSLESLAIVKPDITNLTGVIEPKRLDVLQVSGEYFATLGVAPRLGRWIGEEDQTSRGIVLTDGLWREAFAADPRVIGKTVYLNEEAYQILGVAPANLWFPRGKLEFALPDSIRAFIPLRMANWEKTGTDAYFYRAIGRLSPGVTIPQAEEELTATLASIPWRSGIVHPTAVRVDALQAATVRASRSNLWLLFGAILSLLLIVCVNLANLSLVRWARQSGELAIRVALGASTRQLLAMCLAESLLLAAAGTGSGLWLAAWLVDIVRAQSGLAIPRLEQSAINAPVIGFTLLLLLFTTVLIGLLPALRISRPTAWGPLSALGRGARASLPVQKLQRKLATLQVALALLLLYAAGLSVVGLVRMLSIPEGYDSGQVAVVPLSPPKTKYRNSELRLQLAEQLVAELRRLPGASAAAITSVLPHEPSWNFVNILTEHTDDRPLSEQQTGYFQSVSQHYFAATGIPLLAGRAHRDRGEAERVALLSRAAAQALFPGADPLGKVIRHGILKNPTRVIGVVGDTYPDGRDKPPANMVYEPINRLVLPAVPLELSLIIRSETGTLTHQSIQQAVATVDPGLGVPEVRFLSQIPRRGESVRSLQALLSGGFACMALFVATAGVYGMVAFSLAQRRRELAIRMALGASERDMWSLVTRESLVPVVWGVLPGIGAAFALAYWGRDLLFATSPINPWVTVLAPLAMLAAAMVPVYTLTRQATRIDPAAALQAE